MVLIHTRLWTSTQGASELKERLFFRRILTLLLEMMYVAVTAVKGDLLNCVQWVSVFSKVSHLSVMQSSATLCFCIIRIVSIAIAPS